MKQAKVLSYAAPADCSANPRSLIVSSLQSRLISERMSAALLCRRLASTAEKVHRRAETAGAFLANYTHPSARNNAQLNVLHELYEKVDALKALVDHINHGFDGWDEIAPLQARASGTLAKLSSKVERAIEKLSRCSERHQPEHFKNIVQAVTNAVKGKFSGRYTDLSSIALVRVVETDEKEVVGTQFTTYLCLKGFRDDKGYAYPVFHVVLTCLVSKSGRFSVNVCTQPQLILPGKFKAGTEAGSIKETVQVTLTALAKHGFNFQEAE